GRSVGPTTVPLDTERLLGQSSTNGTSRSSQEKGTSSLDLTNILRGGQVASRKTILTNVFHPGKEFDDPALFSGRSMQVVDLPKAMHAEGSCPIIYGDRGLGKSSLALQAQRIAMGDPSLLQLQETAPAPRLTDVPSLQFDNAGVEEWAFSQEESYLAFYVACSDATPTTKSVLQRLINSLTSVDI